MLSKQLMSFCRIRTGHIYTVYKSVEFSRVKAGIAGLKAYHSTFKKRLLLILEVFKVN